MNLPIWRQRPDGQHDCDDPAQVRFAIEAASHGFDLVRCDKWLAPLPAGSERDYLLDLRAHAQVADFNSGAMRAALRALLLEHHRIEGRPLLKAGADVARARRRGGEKTKKNSQRNTAQQDAMLRHSIKEIIRVHGPLKRVALAAMLADRHGCSAEYLRKKLPRLLAEIEGQGLSPPPEP